MAADAEGASRVVTLTVSGAQDHLTARRAGRAIADSALVRAAFYGGDPNWGRLVGALGATDVVFELDDVAVAFDGVVVASGGVAAPFDEEALLARLAHGDFSVDVTIGGGPGTAAILTTDLTPDYARLNGERS
jgi:glutamate N-acetyltransferase/amino-acid N-acetyltransferase